MSFEERSREKISIDFIIHSLKIPSASQHALTVKFTTAVPQERAALVIKKMHFLLLLLRCFSHPQAAENYKIMKKSVRK